MRGAITSRAALVGFVLSLLLGSTSLAEDPTTESSSGSSALDTRSSGSEPDNAQDEDYRETPASSQGGKSDEDWRFSLTPHLWFPSQSGTSRVKGVGADVNLTIEDSLEQTNWALFLMGGARKGKLTFGSYLMAAQLESDDTALNFVNIETESTIVVLDFVAGYQVYERQVGPDQDQKLRIDLFGGLRYQNLKADVEVGVFNVDERHDWVEPLVGGSLAIQITDNFRWDATRLGFSGFGIGSASNLTVSFFSGGAWSLKENLDLTFGYRAYSLDYSRGSGSDRFSQDILIHGPLVGLTFKF